LAAVAIPLSSCDSGGKQPKLLSQVPEQNAAEPAGSHAPVVAETELEMVNVNIQSDPELILQIRGKYETARSDAVIFLGMARADEPQSACHCRGTRLRFFHWVNDPFQEMQFLPWKVRVLPFEPGISLAVMQFPGGHPFQHCRRQCSRSAPTEKWRYRNSLLLFRRKRLA
jgi:hypothetical protein